MQLKRLVESALAEDAFIKPEPGGSTTPASEADAAAGWEAGEEAGEPAAEDQRGGAAAGRSAAPSSRGRPNNLQNQFIV